VAVLSESIAGMGDSLIPENPKAAFAKVPSAPQLPLIPPSEDASIPIAPKKKIVVLIEDPVFWGGIGILVGGAAATVNMAILFCAGWVCFAITALRLRVFQKRGVVWESIGGATLCILLGAAVYLMWRVTPKPKDAPTLEQIAGEMHKQIVSTIPQSRPSPTAEKTPNPTQQAQDRKSKAKAPPIRQSERTQPTESPSETRSSSPNAPPQVGQLILTQVDDVSTRSDAPYKTNVTIQTTVAMPSLKLLLKCDVPILEAHGGPTQGGMLSGVREGIANADHTVFFFQYAGATPPFGPSNPFVITVWSASPAICNQAQTF
jgi:hypothetical protein